MASVTAAYVDRYNWAIFKLVHLEVASIVTASGIAVYVREVEKIFMYLEHMKIHTNYAVRSQLKPAWLIWR